MAKSPRHQAKLHVAAIINRRAPLQQSIQRLHRHRDVIMASDTPLIAMPRTLALALITHGIVALSAQVSNTSAEGVLQ